jgi:hypothetical protein
MTGGIMPAIMPSAADLGTGTVSNERPRNQTAPPQDPGQDYHAPVPEWAKETDGKQPNENPIA